MLSSRLESNQVRQVRQVRQPITSAPVAAGATEALCNSACRIGTAATRQALEAAALAAHARGDAWNQFWPAIADNVSQAEPSDYLARGRLIHKLVGLVASGDVDGQRPVDGGYGRPLDFELEAIEATR